LLLWGFKTAAAFDVWSFEHFLNGISLAAFAGLFIDTLFKKHGFTGAQKRILNFILTFALALLWENIEHYAETGLFGATVAYWFQGVEHWSNRLVADNLMVLLGWYVYMQKKSLSWAAKSLSLIWLLVHIFVFPHSMYLHILFGAK
jgi:hypothetical protein